MNGVRVDQGAFPNVPVYMRMEPSGAVYSVVFDNPELPRGWRRVMANIGFFALLFSAVPL